MCLRIPPLGFCFHYPFPGLVFKEWLDECVQGMNVPGLVDKMDSSEAGRKAVLGGKKETHTSQCTSQVRRAQQDRHLEQPASSLRLKHPPASGGRDRKHAYFPAVTVSSVPLASLFPCSSTAEKSYIRPVFSKSQLYDL